MGRFGWHSGNVKAQNIQAGAVDITTDGNGDGTNAVTFKDSFKATPQIVITQQEADTTGTLNATSVTVGGFTAKIDGSSITTDDVSCSWIAVDDGNRA